MTEMEGSQSNIDLYPERRGKVHNQSPRANSHGKIETSPSFEPSTSNDKPKPRDDDQLSSSKSQSNGNQRKQMLLSFTPKGTLTTKPPLTNPTPRSDASRLSLAEIANETIALLPGLLATRPDVGKAGYLVKQPPPLDPTKGPHLPPTTVRVIDVDTITAALSLPPSTTAPQTPPLILNMANATHAGGGFKHGALAQEEALCYRSSLFFTLKIRFYPLPDRAAIYSPRVLVIRESMADGHALLDFRRPANLPVVSAVSAAAVCLPELVAVRRGQGRGQSLGQGSGTLVQDSNNRATTYAKPSDRALTAEKMRIVLRTAARNGHRQIVLGAFGCGAFRNPVHEVAALWRGVLLEPEFRGGGWWEDVVFAVLGGGTAAGASGRENFEVFEDVLGRGLVVV